MKWDDALDWKQVYKVNKGSSCTYVAQVPGGLIYRHVLLGYHNTVADTVSMVFVPT